MRIFVGLITLCFIGASVFQVLQLNTQRKALSENSHSLQERINQLAQENTTLENTIRYLGENENIAREIKQQLNYTRKNEKLIIIVPEKKDR